MYSSDSCTFEYIGTDSAGHLMKFKNTTFYIGFDQDYKAKSLFKPHHFSEIEYNELDMISANSTIANEYKVQNVLSDDFAYWSSKLYNYPNCPPIELSVTFI
jgi:hypothetical protein